METRFKRHDANEYRSTRSASEVKNGAACFSIQRHERSRSRGTFWTVGVRPSGTGDFVPLTATADGRTQRTFHTLRDAKSYVRGIDRPAVASMLLNYLDAWSAGYRVTAASVLHHWEDGGTLATLPVERVGAPETSREEDTEVRTWFVTVKAFGRVETRRVRAASRRVAEEGMLADVGFSVTSEEVV